MQQLHATFLSVTPHLSCCAQLDQVAGIEEMHHFKKAAKDEGVAPRERVVRCGKEMAGLATDLPCSPSSSVFVRVDQQNVVLWRALITGELHAVALPAQLHCLRGLQPKGARVSSQSLAAYSQHWQRCSMHVCQAHVFVLMCSCLMSSSGSLSPPCLLSFPAEWRSWE